MKARPGQKSKPAFAAHGAPSACDEKHWVTCLEQRRSNGTAQHFIAPFGRQYDLLHGGSAISLDKREGAAVYAVADMGLSVFS
jgi:hypothetical protein